MSLEDLSYSVPGPNGPVDAPGGVLDYHVSGKIHRATVTVENTGAEALDVDFTLSGSSRSQADAVESYELEPASLSLAAGASGELAATVRLREGHVMGEPLTLSLLAAE